MHKPKLEFLIYGHINTDYLIESNLKKKKKKKKNQKTKKKRKAKVLKKTKPHPNQ